MGSPFYNKDKSKLQKPAKVQQLDEVVINAPKGKAFGSKAMKNHATYKLPKTAELPKQVKVDNIPSRPLKTPSERIVKKSVAEPINEKLIKHSTITPIEAYTPSQFEGAKPLVQSSQRKIYSTFKEQMEQLKNK